MIKLRTRHAASTTVEPVQDQPEPTAEGEILSSIPRHLDFLFEERPLLPGEQADQYDTLLQSIIAQVKPKDVIEALWSKDVVDLIWEARRYKRWRDQIISYARHEAAVICVLPMLITEDPYGLELHSNPASRAEALASGWLKGNEPEITEFEKKLSLRGLTIADVTAHAFHLKLAEIERVQRMIFSADQRRDGLLREIARKRSRLGHDLRDATDVIDAEASAPAVAAPSYMPSGG